MTPRVQIVTTMNAAGWKQTGRRMVESMVRFWEPKLLPIALYAEGFWPDHPGVSPRALPKWVDAFKARNGRAPKRIGQTSRGYDYRFDACKFVHKVGAVADAARHCHGILIWIDADTLTHAPVEAAWIAGMTPGPGEALAWLDRLAMHPECGFLIFDMRQGAAVRVIDEWAGLYQSDRVFALPETHDSYALAHVVAQMKIKPRSLSGNARETFHAFVNSDLGSRMDHMKGARKTLARSPAEDLKWRRPEPHWKPETAT